MRLPDSVILGTTVSLALSHCEERNVTEGILLCSSESDLRKIAETVLWARPLAAHPVALPAIICGFLADVLDYRVETTWEETYQLETASGQSGLLLGSHGGVLTSATPAPDRSQTRRQERSLSRRSIGLAQLALAWETYTQTLADLTQLVDQFLHSDAASQSRTKSAGALIGDEPHQALQHEVDYLSQRAASLMLRARYLRGRLELQNTAVNSISPYPTRPPFCLCGNGR
jgi:hypothetical protein